VQRHNRVVTKRSYVVGLLALAVCASACSSGGIHGAPSRHHGSRPVAVAEKLGPCPRRMPTTSLTTLNAGIAGLNNKLVPVVAVKVRLCSYVGIVVQDSSGFHDEAKQLLGSRLLSGPAAKKLEDDANALAKGGPSGCGSPPVPGRFVQFFLLTFASDTRAVDVEEEYPSCNPGPFNGKFLAQLDSGKWHSELTRDSTTTTKNA
jgi:hypothetical protein